MKNKHTPGPWHVNHWSQEAGKGVYCRELNKNGISYYTGDLVTYSFYGIRAKLDPLAHTIEGSFEGAHITDINDRNEESLANARLIAIAPEMFEAMEEFVDRVEKGEVKSTKTYNKFKTILEKCK